MTQGENIHPCPRKKTKKRRQSSQSKIGGKQKKKIPNQRSEENKKEKKKIPDQRLGENKEKRKSLIKDNERIIQKGLWTR